MDTLTPAQRSERMRRVRAAHTRPELAVRKLVHGLGYRYRLHRRDLPGRPDLVFVKRRKVIFVHGCFWHSHPDPGCRLARMPKSRGEFWRPKLLGNRRRDEDVASRLVQRGWTSLAIWECQLKDLERLENIVREFLDAVD